MINQNQLLHKASINDKRMSIKGFGWISSQALNNKIDLLGSKGFKKFRIEDQKKKWKIRNCENFKGFDKRIEQLLNHKTGLYEQNTNKAKQDLYQKQVEEISLKNKIEKMSKLKQVTVIYEKQKNQREGMVQRFFNQEAQWIKDRFD